MNSLIKWFGANWKTNLFSAVAFAYSVPQFARAVQQWMTGQHADWRPAIVSVIVAAGLAVAKDSSAQPPQDPQPGTPSPAKQ